NVDPLHRQHVDIRDVAGGQSEVLVDVCTIDDQGVCPFQLAEGGAQSCRLGFLLSNAVDNDQRASLGLGRERMLESKSADLLGQVDCVATRGRTECTATTTELGSLAVAVTRAARTLLLQELLAGACAFRAVLDVVRTSHGLELLVADHAVQNVGTDFKTEDSVVQSDSAGRLTVESGYLEFHLLRFSRSSGLERTRQG